MQVPERYTLPCGALQLPWHQAGPGARTLDQHSYQLRLPRRPRPRKPRLLSDPSARLCQGEI